MDGLKYLKNLLVKHQSDLTEWADNEKEVTGTYGELFKPNNLHSLSEKEFHSFLAYKNNKHWTGINRQSGSLTKDMSKLQSVLGILLNESQPIKSRLDQLFPKKGDKMLIGLGRAVTTPILHVVYPEKYGVYNTKTEWSLKFLNKYPKSPRGSSFAEEYIKVNNKLLELAHHFEISLWQLDSLWHLVTEKERI